LLPAPCCHHIHRPTTTFKGAALAAPAFKVGPGEFVIHNFSEDWLKLFAAAAGTYLPVPIHLILIASLSKASPANSPGPLKLLLYEHPLVVPQFMHL
jgi:hypothetical protein